MGGRAGQLFKALGYVKSVIPTLVWDSTSGSVTERNTERWLIKGIQLRSPCDCDLALQLHLHV